MKCDRCGEYITADPIYPVYKRETGEKAFLCYRCWYIIFERESDIEYKKMLKKIADECHNKRMEEKRKNKWWHKLFRRN